MSRSNQIVEIRFLRALVRAGRRAEERIKRASVVIAPSQRTSNAGGR